MKNTFNQMTDELIEELKKQTVTDKFQFIMKIFPIFEQMQEEYLQILTLNEKIKSILRIKTKPIKKIRVKRYASNRTANAIYNFLFSHKERPYTAKELEDELPIATASTIEQIVAKFEGFATIHGQGYTTEDNAQNFKINA